LLLWPVHARPRTTRTDRSDDGQDSGADAETAQSRGEDSPRVRTAEK
jgi:hypothetical protein